MYGHLAHILAALVIGLICNTIFMILAPFGMVFPQNPEVYSGAIATSRLKAFTREL